MPSKHVIELSEYAGLRRSISSVFSLFDRRRRSAPGSFFTTSTTSRISVFSSSSSSTLRRSASASSQTAPALRLRRGEGLLDWLAFLFLGCSAAMPPLRYALTQLWTAPMLTPSRSAACFCCMPPSTSSIAFVLVSKGMMGFAIWPAYLGSFASQRSRHCLVGYPRCSTTWAVVIGVVKYNSTARSRSSGLNIRKSFRSVSKKTSAAPYPLPWCFLFTCGSLRDVSPSISG